jgi:hypothetical protein
MCTPKFLIVVLGLVLAASSYAADYTLSAAAAAAGKLMPKDGPKEFSLFNLPEPKAKPKQLLTTMQQARDQKVCLAICSPKLEYIRDLLKGTMKAAKAEKFDGLYLIIVAEQMDSAGFDTLLKDRGIHVRYGVYE